MTHLNNSNNGISNIPKIQPDYSPTPFQTERFFVILLIIIGIAGAVYTFNIGFKSSLSKQTSQITKNISLSALKANIPSSPTQVITSVKAFPKTQLRISGEKEANHKIEFTIDSFDKKADYNLSMGDGKILQPKDKTIEYTYKKPGNFTVELEVNFNGRSEKIFSEEIQILESIAVAPNAHQEY